MHISVKQVYPHMTGIVYNQLNYTMAIGHMANHKHTWCRKWKMYPPIQYGRITIKIGYSHP